ncbi:OmpA family protein [bacterium]|nr:OmpA family protein [bacterium]
MAIKFRKKMDNDFDSGNIFWVTMSDLMLGLAIVFITLFVLAMTGFTQQTMQQQKVKMDVAKEISQELKKHNIDVKIDNMTGDLIIPSTALFEVNSYILTPSGKALLSKLAPIYVNTLFKKKELINDVESILIQGHTDSQTFAGVNSVDEQFVRNMDLSLKRANSVASYILQTDYDKSNSQALRKMIVVEGKSFNEPIIVDGHEDYAKSRRVELKIKVKDWSVASMFGLTK